MKEVINSFLERGYLLSPDFIQGLDEFSSEEQIIKHIDTKITGDKPLVINKDLQRVLQKTNKIININWLEFEKSKALLEKGKNGKIYQTFLDILEYNPNEEKKEKINSLLGEIKEEERTIELLPEENEQGSVIVIDEYKEDEKKREMQDFVKYFKYRYNVLKEVLQERIELRNPISINRISNQNQGEPITLIGLIIDKRVTKNGNISLTLEDPTGSVNVLVNKGKTDIYNLAKNTVLDEVIGVNGSCGNNIIFANDILFPDVPLSKELKKAKDEVYAVFISDLHVGSRMFLQEDFQNFLNWLNGEYGNHEQKNISKKVKYLFIIGDLVDGIGIYPEQDKELVIKDIKKQYEKCAEYLAQIRKDIKIVICSGNHDALRIAEPQPKLNTKFAEQIYNLKNATIVTNPAVVNIHSSQNFPGFDILLYHGYSFDYYVSNVDTIRMNGGYDRADLIMKFLLQKRHLAPTHGSTLYMPDTKKDALIINRVPDLFVTGHIHKANISHYKNITTICCSCWQSKTTFQEKVGHNPEPSRVPIVNLKTREAKMLKFGG
ncbi:MAG: DNA-directed DNA polymerase II small subunit [Nanoarchaeota archaeon]|nr:DNA-directed DNA polymerase II small subunit [Nanoarchaeota archaeon]